MIRHRFSVVLAAVLLAALIAACGQEPADTGSEAAVVVEAIDGSELHRITLSEHAAARLAIETGEVQEATVAGERRKVVPYAAVLWDSTGAAWVYTSPEQRVFIRAPITVDRIDGDQAILIDGPDSGTAVVIQGASELWGSDTGVGGGH